jgi:hypothetical protein
MSSIRIKVTKLVAQHVVVITNGELRSYCLQPYSTYTVTADGAVSNLASFTSAAAALQRHEQLVRRAVE